MIRNYLKITWRNFVNNKRFSLINTAGLAMGIACSLFIFLWVRDERSMDNFHANGKRLYLLYERESVDGKMVAGYWTPGLLARELKKELPEVEAASPFMNYNGVNFEANGKIIKQDGLYADSDYFKMFSYPLLQGSPSSALGDPSAISISAKMAQRFFGAPEMAMGKTVRWQNRRNFTITAVFADPPAHSTQKFDFVINWTAQLEENGWLKDWTNNSPQTAIMLRPNTDPARVASTLKNFLARYNHTFTKTFWLQLGMQPFGETYLHSNFENGNLSGGRITYINLFLVVGVFILLIACINFMNLTTARSVKRSREIGIRKVAGAIRGSLVRQFLGEAVLLTAVASCLAVILVNGLLPFFNTLTGKEIVFPVASVFFWTGLCVLTLVTGLIAGSYPALFLSSLKPIQVLKGSMAFSGAALFFRKGLVVFQFVLSIVLIIGTIIVAQQIRFVQQAELGFNKDHLIYIPLEGELPDKYALFKQQAEQVAGVQSVSRLTEAPIYIGGVVTGSVNWTGKDPHTYPQFTVTGSGYDFVKTMQLTLLQGRDFSTDFATDSTAVMVNEEALKIIPYKDPIGKPIELWGKKGVIVGVLKDFHLTSLHEPIQPLIVHLSDAYSGGSILVRTAGNHTADALAALKKIADGLNPKFSFSFLFTDQEYARMYESEQVISSLSRCFAGLAIFISALGLLGLAMFTAEQRLKEIGIRKILGAGLFNLFRLLSGEFLLLVGIALLIASPLAWWVMHNWLQQYAYHVSIGWPVFAAAGAVALFIALCTISFQTIKSVLINPVRSLRSE